MNTVALSRKIEAVDLFCGVGGLTSGLIKSGIVVKAGYDIEESCRFAYEHNNQGAVFVNKDIQEVTADEIQGHYSKNVIRLLAGCAPCQPFSTYNQGKDVRQDKKWPLLYAFARLITEIKPELVTMENVPDVIKHDVYHDFVANLEKEGYHVSSQKVLCADYGVAQRRNRHVLLASKIGEIKLIDATHKNNHVTIKDVIEDFPPLVNGEQSPIDILHICSKLSPVNLRRIQASVQGGTWRDWPEDLILNCHKKKSGVRYGSVYGRMAWDKPSPTITTQCYGFGNGRFGHPDQDRAISLREAASIQSFPPTYKFWPDKKLSISAVGKMIGNAVPVLLGAAIGKSFTKALDFDQE